MSVEINTVPSQEHRSHLPSREQPICPTLRRTRERSSMSASSAKDESIRCSSSAFCGRHAAFGNRMLQCYNEPSRRIHQALERNVEKDSLSATTIRREGRVYKALCQQLAAIKLRSANIDPASQHQPHMELKCTCKMVGKESYGLAVGFRFRRTSRRPA
jgi:hypothetical protein